MPTRTPLSEARPLRWAELDDTERGHLERIVGWLGAMRDDALAHPRSPSGVLPWARVDRHRTTRTIFVDGPRGTGKTSLLITLLHGLACNDDPAGWSMFGDADGVAGARACFEPGARTVRALSIRDIHPIPADVPLRGWLVDAFRAAAHFADAPVPAAPARDERPSAAGLWADAFRHAIIGWSQVGAQERSPVERIGDHDAQAQLAQRLPDRFGEFVDVLIARLEERGLPPGALLLVPIDDVDLQVDRAAELPHAIRLLHHPRVVWIVTGDRAHLQRMTRLSFVGEAVRLAGGVDTEVDEEEAGALAVALVEKAFPREACIRMPRLSLKVALSTTGAPLVPVLDRMRTAEGEPVGSWLAAMDLPGRYTTWRKLQRAVDRMPDTPLEALATLFRIAGSPARVMGRHVVLQVSGAASARASASFWIPTLTGRAVVGTRVQFSGHPAALVAASLNRAGVPVVARVLWEPDPVLAWTEIQGARFWWSWARKPGPAELVRWAGDWGVWARPGLGIDRVIHGWLAWQLAWNGGERPAEARGEPPSAEEWASLVRALHDRPQLRGFAENDVPLFAAPEHGMSDVAARQLLDAVLTTMFDEAQPEGLVTTIAQGWSDARAALTARAIWEVREEEAERAAAAAGRAVEVPAWPSDEDVTMLLRRVERGHGNAPFLRLREPHRWWIRAPECEAFRHALANDFRLRIAFETMYESPHFVTRALARTFSTWSSSVLGLYLARFDDRSRSQEATFREVWRELATRAVAAGGDPGLVDALRIGPQGGLVLSRTITLRACPKLEEIAPGIRVATSFGWEVTGLDDAPPDHREGLAAWVAAAAAVGAAREAPVTGFRCEVEKLLQLSNRPLPVPRFANPAQTLHLVEAWLERAPELQAQARTERADVIGEWGLRSLLDLSASLYTDWSYRVSLARTSLGMRAEELRRPLELLRGAAHRDPSVTDWLDRVRATRTIRSRLPESIRSLFETTTSS